MSYKRPYRHGGKMYTTGNKRTRAAPYGIRRYYPRQTSSTGGSVVPGFTRRSGFYGRYHTAVSKGTGELKFDDENIAPTLITNLGFTLDSLNLVPQGVSESERIGRKFTVRHISVNFLINLDSVAVATGATENVLVLLYLDRQANGVGANVVDILKDSANDHSLSRLELSNSDRFRILKRKLITLNATVSDTSTDFTGPTTRQVEWNVKCKIPIEMSATSGAMSTIRSNNIGMLFISYYGRSTVVGTTRIMFSDE